jgi:hypothetical protein
MSKGEKNIEEKKLTPLEIFLRIQKSGGISPAIAAKWCAEIRRERRASSIKMYERSKKAWAEVGRKY